MGKKKSRDKSGKNGAERALAAAEAVSSQQRDKTSGKRSDKKEKRAKKADSQAGSGLSKPMTEALRVTAGFDLAAQDTRSTPGFDGKKKDAEKLMESCADELSQLQERLYADGTDGEPASVLLVVQGMDTSGKGGIMRHVVGQVDPQGVEVTAFKAPTAAEKAKPFLWRIRQALPKPGMIGVFDRSHYEDVLIVRVHNLVPPSTWQRRYGQINTFEAGVQAKGTRIIKVMLNISPEEQKERLAERLDRPDKYWKFNPGDITEREYWPGYQEAYQVALNKTSTDEAPWYVVPADRKWFARLAVQQLLLETLRDIDPQWPPADFDVALEKERLAAT